MEKRGQRGAYVMQIFTEGKPKKMKPTRKNGATPAAAANA